MTVAELTRKTHGPEVLATRDGKCVKCTGPIEAREDFICKVDGVKGWFHAFCAAGYCETVNRELDLEAAMGDLGRLERPFPVNRCDRQTCRCVLEDAAAAYLFTDLEEDRLVVLCDGCARVAESEHSERFEVVPL